VIKKDSDWMDLNINVLSEKTRDVEWAMLKSRRLGFDDSRDWNGARESIEAICPERNHCSKSN
jgi:hypothetical protein